MGTIKKGILGGFSGKVGTVVGASWKGIDYIRSLPTTVRNPRTPGQVNQRGKFATVISFLTKIAPIINIGFKNFTGKQTAFNAAMSYNLLNAVTGDAGVYQMDFPNVMVSRGTLYKPISGEAEVADGEVAVGWDVNVAGNGSLGDMSNILVYNTSKNEAMVSANASDRAESYAGVIYHDHWKGDQVEVYLFFTSEDGKLVSDSMYMGQYDIPAI